MEHQHGIIAAAVVILLGACVPDCVRTAGATTPDSSSERAPAHQHRILVLPVSYEYDAKKAGPEGGEDDPAIWYLARDTFTVEVMQAVEAKGYQVAYLSDKPDVLRRLTALPSERIAADCAALRVWARSALVGAPPSQDVWQRTREIGRITRADRLLVIQGAGSTTVESLTILQIGLYEDGDLWMVADQVAFRVDLFEVATGVIVWRSEFPREGLDRGMAPLSERLWTLFGDLPRIGTPE
jgi:hypothetical protein